MISRYLGITRIGRFLRSRLIFTGGLLCLSLLFGSAQGAELRADSPGLDPSDIIEIAGSGYSSGDLIDLHLVYLVDTVPIDSIHLAGEVSADTEGNFATQVDVQPLSSTPTSLIIQAVGSSSGLAAATTVFSPNTMLSFSLGPTGAICRDTANSSTKLDICAELYQKCGGQAMPLPGREIQILVGEGDCSISTEDKHEFLVMTDAEGRACLTIEGLDTLLAADKISFRAKFPGEDKPGNNEPPNSACQGAERVNLSASNGCYSVDVFSGCPEADDIFDVSQSDTADFYFVRTADLNRDNFVDVVYTGSVTQGLFVAFGSDADSLEDAVNLLDVNEATFDFGFLNGDTLLDIVATRGGMMYFLYNIGNRQFSIDSIQAAPAARAAVASVSAGHFNADVFVDVVVAPDLLLLGDAEESYTDAVPLPRAFDVAQVADFDRDGFDDIVMLASDSLFIYLNDGSGGLFSSYALQVGTYLLEIPPIFAVADLNRDGATDVAVVLPKAGTGDQSEIVVGLNDGTGVLSTLSSIMVTGIAYNVSANDINRDNVLDLIVANGTTSSLDVYYGDGLGGFTGPDLQLLDAQSSLFLALASLDVDRDGNIDFVTGELGGGNLVLAVNQESDEPVLFDEMSTVGFDGVEQVVIDPDGYVISPDFRTVAGSDYQQVDLNGDGQLDDRTLNYNLEYGEYTVVYKYDTGTTSGDNTLNAIIGINGSQKATTFLDYNAGGVNRAQGDAAQTDSLVFYYTVEEISSIQPPNGIPVNLARPQLDWSILAADYPGATAYHFQLDRYYDFRSPIFEEMALGLPYYDPPQPLGNDSVFYWRFRVYDGSAWSDFSRTFALYITGVCCVGNVGNIDFDPDVVVDMTDLTLLAGYLFGGGQLPDCPGIADVDWSDGRQINILDLTYIVDYMFGGGPLPPMCP